MTCHWVLIGRISYLLLYNFGAMELLSQPQVGSIVAFQRLGNSAMSTTTIIIIILLIVLLGGGGFYGRGRWF